MALLAGVELLTIISAVAGELPRLSVSCLPLSGLYLVFWYAVNTPDIPYPEFIDFIFPRVSTLSGAWVAATLAAETTSMDGTRSKQILAGHYIHHVDCSQ